MPVLLQDRSKFSVLGQCEANIRGNGHFPSVGMEENDRRKSSTYGIASAVDGQWSCGCHELDGLLGSIGSSYWIRLVYDSNEQHGGGVVWIPKLQHIHWNGQIVSQCDVHVCKS